MAGFFSLLALVFVVVVVLHNRVTKRAFDVAETTLDESLRFIEKSAPKMFKAADTGMDLLSIGVASSRDAAMQAYFDTLKARYQVNDVLDAKIALKADLMTLHDILDL